MRNGAIGLLSAGLIGGIFLLAVLVTDNPIHEKRKCREGYVYSHKLALCIHGHAPE